MKKVYVILGIFMLFSFLAAGQVSEKTVEKSRNSRRTVIVMDNGGKTTDSTKTVLNGPGGKKIIRKGEAADELSPLEGARAKRARQVNGDKFFLEYQENRSSSKEGREGYDQLTVRGSNRKNRYLNVKRGQMADDKLRDYVAKTVTEKGYPGVIKNFNQYDGYMFQIIPVTGGETVSAHLKPGEECRTELIAGRYIGLIFYGGREVGRTVFDVPNRTFFEGQWTDWCFFQKRN